MNVPRFRILILLAVSLLAAVAVAVSGTIGFVGLLVPHLAAYLVGRNAARLVPTAALLGGAVALVLADILARSLSDTTELPIGGDHRACGRTDLHCHVVAALPAGQSMTRLHACGGAGPTRGPHRPSRG